jgi:biopolymer transport protein ExbD
MMIDLVIVILLLLLSATTIPVANAFSKLPPTYDESSDDKECAAFQIIVNQSHAYQLDS